MSVKNTKQIRLNMATISDAFISRSAARSLLAGTEQFTAVVLDFEHVRSVGQGFADEVFRVFHNKYPNIALSTVHMSKEVKFMIERAQNEAKISKE